MSETIHIRQENPDETDSMASIEHPDNDVYGYISRQVADQLGEYMELTLSDEAEVEASLDAVTGKGSGNYARFEVGNAVVGFGISLDLLEQVLGFEVERDEDGIVQNAPESVGMLFSASTEEEYEESQEPDEEAVSGLIASGSDDDSDDEEEVEISDEEIGLVDAE